MAERFFKQNYCYVCHTRFAGLGRQNAPHHVLKSSIGKCNKAKIHVLFIAVVYT